MTIVKGSPQYQLKVVRYRPWLRYALSVAGLGFFVAGLVAAFEIGHREGSGDTEETKAELKKLERALSHTQYALTKARQELENIYTGAEIDKQATEDVRQEMLKLKEQLAQIEEQNSFYRSLMEPTDANSGINFGSVDIIDTDVPRQYKYKVVIQQLARQHRTVRGKLSFIIVGNTLGTASRYRLSDLSEEYSSEAIKLNFKYFQNIEGMLALPQDFEPQRIELVAQITGNKATKIEKRFGWLVEES